jgi:cytochrome c oxidase subunit 2
MKKFVIPILLTLVISVPLIIFFLNVDLLPAAAGKEAESIDTLFQVLLSLASVIFGLVIAFILYSLIAFRRQPGDLQDAKPVYGNIPLEVTWTVIPLVIVIALGVYGTNVLLGISRPAGATEEEVKVVGFQWGWRFEYPEYGITSSELVLPVDRQALLRLTSIDVIHSFWVPEFRIKTDAIPDHENQMRITPTEVGDYNVLCAELCGTAHAYMKAPARVLSQSDFDAWVAAQMEQTGAAETRGQEWSAQFGCLACHSIDGSNMVGPTWQGLFGSMRTFEDGTSAEADEEYLYTAIMDPAAHIVQNYPNQMPTTYSDQLTDEQITDIIEYIRSLQ